MRRNDILRLAVLAGVVAGEMVTLGVPVVVHHDRLEGVNSGVEFVSIPETDFARTHGLNNRGIGFNADLPGGNHVMVRFRNPQELFGGEK